MANPPSNASTSIEVGTLSLGKPAKNKRTGTATLPVNTPGPGRLELSGKGLKRVSSENGIAFEAGVNVETRGRRKRKLRKRGKVKVKPSVTFTPSGGGDAQTEKARFRLRKR